ncbi:hypothetical protein LEP1GSC029_5186 [Leptospira interrogans str. 2002000626]|uniref:Uncharacterized protein n=1 Tax=Leptospira interrogans str. 2002000626 TaxID=996803 RepID=A0A829D822_LEPIR|nr:hypothetical protein LEP1GSC029_5186 [Leptospira interrogans str. 2002000626]
MIQMDRFFSVGFVNGKLRKPKIVRSFLPFKNVEKAKPFLYSKSFCDDIRKTVV